MTINLIFLLLFLALTLLGCLAIIYIQYQTIEILQLRILSLEKEIQSISVVLEGLKAQYLMHKRPEINTHNWLEQNSALFGIVLGLTVVFVIIGFAYVYNLISKMQETTTDSLLTLQDNIDANSAIMTHSSKASDLVDHTYKTLAGQCNVLQEEMTNINNNVIEHSLLINQFNNFMLKGG